VTPSGQKYKVKLTSGRILGPLDLERVHLLIQKNQIIGTEMARPYPDGDWQDINRISEIAALLISHAGGTPHKNDPADLVLDSYEMAGTPTQMLPGTAGQEGLSIPELKTLGEAGGDATAARALNPALEELGGDRTVVAERSDASSMGDDNEGERTEMVTIEPQPRAPSKPETPESNEAEDALGISLDMEAVKPRNVSAEKTVMLQRPTKGGEAGGARSLKQSKGKQFIRATIVAIALGLVGYEFLMLDEQPQTKKAVAELVRPKQPTPAPNPDPQKSEATYLEAVPFYLEDTAAGYIAAVSKLQLSASYQIENVKALAMLASSYLNLIDSSNKDENYFSVIYSLIEKSRARGPDLAETVISDVEFFITVNKPEVAQDRIVNYTRTHQNFAKELFYYLALTFLQRGDAHTAARYISQIADQKAFSPKVFYLRGVIAEKLGDNAQALGEYEKAIVMNRRHAKSRLAIARLQHSAGNLKLAADHLDFLVANANLLGPRDLALAYHLHGLLSQLFKRWDIALSDAERAVALDKGNHEYVLELYSLRAKAGDTIQALRKEARMYFYLGEGQRLRRQGKYQEALNNFLLARQSSEKSIVPLIAIGDLFAHQNDLSNARTYYAKAAAIAKNDIEVWSKYIDILIQSYEWEEAQAAMDKFRKMPVSQSAIDKAAADIYAKQGNLEAALGLYRKAMTRDRIDSDVYLAYAETLVATKTRQGFDQAPFFYALALRFDPLNFKALIGTAKCIAATESIDRAINMLRDELQKSNSAHPELLAAIAEFQMQKGDWDQAQQNVSQAIASNSEYAYSWLLQARIYLNRESSDKTAMAQALDAFKAYSDRNSADPTGYLERYRIYTQRAEFELAREELNRVQMVYPKYPNLRYYSGALYAVMKNHKEAISEFRAELKNNPNSVTTLIALGKELVEAGDAQKALEPLAKAMQLAARSAEPKAIAGYANYLLKNYGGAIALFHAAIALDPANPLIHKRLGMAYEASGDSTSAATAYRKYIQMEPDAPDRDLYEKYR